MNNINNPFKPKDVKLVNYNSINYENQKMNNIVDNKMNMFGKMNNISNVPSNNKPTITNTTSYSGNAIEKEREVRSKVDSLNRMNNGFRNN